MTVLSLPASEPGPVLNWCLKRWSGLRSRVSRVKAPVSVRNASKMPLTVIGIGCVVAGILTVSLIAGLIVLGVALIAFEYLIADE